MVCSDVIRGLEAPNQTGQTEFLGLDGVMVYKLKWSEYNIAYNQRTKKYSYKANRHICFYSE